MRLNLIVKGLATYIPGMYEKFAGNKTGGTTSSTYCYEVWIKHLTMLQHNGMHTIPATVAELGPGDSIGMGLAALLSGVHHYHAFDVIKYANTDRNLVVFDELVELFKRRAPRPSKGWPDYDGYLDENLFPGHILSDEHLEKMLAPERLNRIRTAIMQPDTEHGDISIKYVVPWNSAAVIKPNSVELIFSHSVLEHVTNLDDTYQAFASWLQPRGWMSHQVDFTAHYVAKPWNAHWSISDLEWKLIIGKRPYLLNRQPVTVHEELLKKNNFEIICLLKRYREDGISRSQLASRWKSLSDDELRCSGVFFQARKP